jgi:hypothetical protein
LARAALQGVCSVPPPEGELPRQALERASRRLRVRVEPSSAAPQLSIGAFADLNIQDALPFGERGLLGFEGPPSWVVARGEVVVREGRLLGAELLDLARAAAEVLEGL